MENKKVTIKGSAQSTAGAVVAVNGVAVGTIRGWRQFTAKWGATGPGFKLFDVNGNHVDSDAYFKQICRRARYWAENEATKCPKAVS